MGYDSETHKASIHLLSALQSMSVAYYFIPEDSRHKAAILKGLQAVRVAVEEMLESSYMKEVASERENQRG